MVDRVLAPYAMYIGVKAKLSIVLKKCIPIQLYIYKRISAMN
jgi:hypothetical protein